MNDDQDWDWDDVFAQTNATVTIYWDDIGTVMGFSVQSDDVKTRDLLDDIVSNADM